MQALSFLFLLVFIFLGYSVAKAGALFFRIFVVRFSMGLQEEKKAL